MTASEEPVENVAITFAATLADEWVHQGVTDVVICPGSRSTPLAVGLLGTPGLRCHVVHDERSASFMALGLGMSSGRAAIVVTTSGTAAVELHAAVVEAHHACVPLLVLTADRPPELQGVGAPQTIDQTRLYGNAVRWFCAPGPPEPEHRDGWRHLAADSIAATRGMVPGPVHVNLAFREPLIGPVGAVPGRTGDTERPAPPTWNVPDEQLAVVAAAFEGRSGVIVAGARAVVDEAERTALFALAETLGWPILADQLSGVRGVDRSDVVTMVDPILRDPAVADRLRPAAVLRLGALHASRVVNEWLARSGAVQVGLDRYGRCPDPDHVLAQTLHADIASTLEALRSRLTDRPELVTQLDRWASAEQAAVERSAEHLARAVGVGSPDEISVAAAALRGVPTGGALMVSSSMPIRDLEWYVAGRSDVTVHSNRGANGIDGVVSTAIGIAAAGVPTVLLIGDVALLHDSSALIALSRRSVDLALVVIDNDGGGIFSFLPQAEALPDEQFQTLFGTPHGTDIAALARAHGLDGAAVSSIDDLDRQLADWSTSGGTRVLVVRSERGENRRVHGRLNAEIAAAVAVALGTVELTA